MEADAAGLASEYSAGFQTSPSPNTQHEAHITTDNIKPPRPPRPTVQYPSPSAAAYNTAPAGGLASDYYSGFYNSPTSNIQHEAHVPSAVPDYSQPPTHPAQSSNSNGAPNAAAAGVTGEAGTYYLGHSHSLQDSYGGHGHQHSSEPQSSPMTMAHRSKRRGPLDKLVDFVCDPEAVGEFEEYTAAIGVCKHCFDPRSSPRDAPRKHHYTRRNSGGKHGSSTRVDKLYRQHSSGEERRKSSSSKAPLTASGLAGYGIAKLGGTLLNNKDFDDTYSVRTGHPNGSQSYLGRVENRPHSRRKKHSSRGDVPDSRPSLQQNVETKIGKHQPRGRMYEERRARRRSSISISSSSSHSGHALHKRTSTKTDIMASKREQRSRQERSPSPKKRYYHKRVSPKHSYVDLSSTISGGAGIRSFFSSPSANRRKGKRPKGLFGFSNPSSSSSDADLAFGEGSVRRKNSNRADHRKDNRNVDSAILGLAATGAALVAASSRKERKGWQNAELIAAKERRDHSSRVSEKRHSHPKKYSSSSEQNSAWEDATDDDSSDNSALAYGVSVSARRSRESLSSSEGTSKWDWRWNRRKQSKPKPGLRNESSIPSGAAALAGAAIGSTASIYNRLGGPESPASLPPMQQLHPMPTSDPAVFDVAKQNFTVISPGTAISPSTSSRVLIQQPKPVMPVSPSVYTTSSPPSAPIYRSASPPVIFPNAQIGDIVNKSTSKPDSRRYTSEGGGRRRRDSSPTPSSVSKDIPQVKPRRRASTRDQASTVKFDLTEEQSQRERRSKKPVGRQSRRNTDEGKRHRNFVNGEEHRKEHRVSSGYVGNNGKAPQSQQGSAERRREREREIERQLERLYEEDRRQISDRKARHEDDSVPIAGVTGATTGMTAAAAIVKSMPTKDEGRRTSEVSREQQSGDESQPRSSSNAVPEEDMAELERRSRRVAQRAAIRVKTTPIPIQHDDYATYFTPSELQEKLQEHNEASERRRTPEPSSPLSPDVIDIAPKIGLSPVSPSSPTSAWFKFDPVHYIPFGIRAKDDPSAHPWPVPRLNLIEPTPPHSARVSVRGTASPVPTLSSEPVQPTEPKSQPSRSDARVSRGEHETHEFDVITPMTEISEPNDDRREVLYQSKGHDQETTPSREHAQGPHDTHVTPAENEELSFLGERPEMPTVSDGASGPQAESNLTRDELAAQPLTIIVGSETSPSAHVAHPASAVFAAQESQESHGRDQDVTSTPQADHTRPRRQSELSVAELTSSPVTTTSPTAVPIHFRRLPVSPRAARSASVSTPGVESGPNSPMVPSARRSRPSSTEFRSSEFRPLWLVERHASSKNDRAEIEQSYPSLPSSRTSSTHPSMENLRGSQDFEDVFEPEPESSQRFAHRRSSSYPHWHDERPKSPDFLDSRTATPTAAEFPREVKKEKPKYEFHSPSELLQDPATFHPQPKTTNPQMSPMQLPRALASDPSDVESLPALPDSRPISPVSIESQRDDDSIMQGIGLGVPTGAEGMESAARPQATLREEQLRVAEAVDLATDGMESAARPQATLREEQLRVAEAVDLATDGMESAARPQATLCEEELRVAEAVDLATDGMEPAARPQATLREEELRGAEAVDLATDGMESAARPQATLCEEELRGAEAVDLATDGMESVARPQAMPHDIFTESPSENAQEGAVPFTSTTDIPTESPSENAQEDAVPFTSTTDIPTESPSEKPQENAVLLTSATDIPTESSSENVQETAVPLTSTTDIPTESPSENVQETAVPLTSTTDIPTESPAKTAQKTAVPLTLTTDIPTESSSENVQETAILLTSTTDIPTESPVKTAQETAVPLTSTTDISTESSSENVQETAILLTSTTDIPTGSAAKTAQETAVPLTLTTDIPTESPSENVQKTVISLNSTTDIPTELPSENAVSPKTPHSEVITAAGATGAAGLGTEVLQPQSRDVSSDGTKSLGTPDLKPTTAKQRRRRQQAVEGLPSSSTYDPVIDKGKEVVRDMAEVYDGYGEVPGSPTRPPSVRKRQSMQRIKELEARLDQLLSENRLLAAAKITAEKELEEYHNNQGRVESASQEALNAREQALKEKDAELGKLREAVEWMRKEVTKLTEVNEGLSSANQALATTHAQLESQHDEKQTQWQESARVLERLKSQNDEKDLQWQESARQLEMLRSQNAEKDVQWQESARELEMLRSQNNEKDVQCRESARELEMLRSQNSEKDVRWQESARELEMLRSQNNEKDVQCRESARELEMLRSQNSEKDVRWQESARELEMLRSQNDEKDVQWQGSRRELEALRSKHEQLSSGMEDIVRHEIETALAAKNAELRQLYSHLEVAKEKIRELQQQIIASRNDDIITTRDEDYFDGACQQLCQHVQQWVLRFSKFSDTRVCRSTNEVRDDQIVDRFENAIVDGSDVDIYLADRIKRRDVFMSVVMTIIWEFVFSRYLFGMDREQRQKLKQLEKQLLEVGPRSAVQRWRAVTLTLLSRRETFASQRAEDTEAVAQEIFGTLSRFLPPPQNLEKQILESLRTVMKMAVDLSIEMRTQRVEYIMLPPLQPEYDLTGDVKDKFTFNAALMNERSGETSSNQELEAQRAVVRMVLFPLVLKRGNDDGEGEEEIVVCPAQVLVARDDKRSGRKEKNGKRVISADRMSIDQKSMRSSHSVAPSTLDMGNVI